MLSSFFYGYILTQIPGGWLAHRFGGKRVISAAMFVMAVTTILTPVCARFHIILVYVMRVLLGIASVSILGVLHRLELSPFVVNL
jgi:MFS family permease